MRPRVTFREAIILAAVGAILAINLAAGGASPAAGQDQLPDAPIAQSPDAPIAQAPEATLAPTATTPPGFQPCGQGGVYFALTNNNPHVGEQISWWATGLQTNTLVIITVHDMLNPNATDSVFKSTTTPNNWCQAMGTLSFNLPIQYQVRLDGVSSSTGQQVSQVIYPFAIPAVVFTPTPIPLQPPAPPSNVKMTQLSRISARVDWDDNSNNEAGFVVSTRVGDFTVAPNTRSLTVGGLETNQIHCFRVYAFNDAGRSIADVDCLHIRPLSQ